VGRDEIWGRDGNTRWQPMLDARNEGLRKIHGPVEFPPDAVIVDRRSWFGFGAQDWKSYELRFGLQILEGANAQIRLRGSPDGQRAYLVDFLLGWQALGVARVDSHPGGKGLQKLSVVNLELARMTEYRVEIAVRELSITTYVEGRLVNQVTDETLEAGPLAFGAWEAKARFSQPQFRILA
jgi:hypothetical protein